MLVVITTKSVNRYSLYSKSEFFKDSQGLISKRGKSEKEIVAVYAIQVTCLGDDARWDNRQGSRVRVDAL
jgi:hypothetical protein